MNSTEFDYASIRTRAMQSLFESLDDLCEGTLVVDKSARIVWINERYAQRFGLASAAEAIGREVESVIPNSMMRDVVRSGQPILLDILEANNESFVVMRIPLKDDSGNVIGAVGFALFDNTQPLKTFYARLGRMQQELAQTRKRLAEERRTRYTFSNFIGSSPAAMEVKRQARRAARLDAPVLLLGETGTGKELLAQAIHASSHRSEKPFIAVNVAAIPESLLEAEFFGVAPGAFTGADRRGRQGKFQLANGGTLFLDEIGDMPLGLQVKLLRAIQEQEVEPVGSERVFKTDVRIIAATSVDLAQKLADGGFRADLYYRLAVLPLSLPPLRDRMSDLEMLCETLLEDIAQRNGSAQRELAPGVLALFRRCLWPGNIRELRNILEQATMLTDSPRLTAGDFVDLVAPTAQAQVTDVSPRTWDSAMADFERQLITEALAACNGKVIAAARRLGMGRATLYKKMAALGLSARAPA
ncbi:MAG TPA: sigma 54-interacting transcriptional regulator [Rhodocyclaceae bacterium]|jgi:transcriptional regulator with PAS, ATPase and Fis domain|nr:sigma 54-interacting transcriptional regulator [Rhodocyclaceae bacterium]